MIQSQALPVLLRAVTATRVPVGTKHATYGAHKTRLARAWRSACSGEHSDFRSGQRAAEVGVAACQNVCPFGLGSLRPCLVAGEEMLHALLQRNDPPQILAQPSHHRFDGG